MKTLIEESGNAYRMRIRVYALRKSARNPRVYSRQPNVSDFTESPCRLVLVR